MSAALRKEQNIPEEQGVASIFIADSSVQVLYWTNSRLAIELVIIIYRTTKNIEERYEPWKQKNFCTEGAL